MLRSGLPAATSDYEPFGSLLAGTDARKGFIDKERDDESLLGDYGVRKYDPETGRFLSFDPLWEDDRRWNSYAYSYDNPMRYTDPTGKKGGEPAMIPNPALPGSLEEFGGGGGGGGGEVIVYWTVKILLAIVAANEASDAIPTPVTPLPIEGDKGKPGTYAPDEKLPADKNGTAKPSAEYPHTQIGARQSKRRDEVYPQAREWDANGKRVKDIDFTDHGRPSNHTNPHEHLWDPQTGRGPAQPLSAGGPAGLQVPSKNVN